MLPTDQLDIAVVNYDNVEVWHGFMPQIIGGRLEPRHMLVPLRTVLPGVTLYPYEVKSIDLANRRVILKPDDEHDNAAIPSWRTDESFPPTAVYTFSQGDCGTERKHCVTTL